jgi:hypothetical protein
MRTDRRRRALNAVAWNVLAEGTEPTFLHETNEDNPDRGTSSCPSLSADEFLTGLLALKAEGAVAEWSAGEAPLSGGADEGEDET